MTRSTAANGEQLPAFVLALLDQSTDPAAIPTVGPDDVAGWYAPLLARVLCWLDMGSTNSSFTSNGHTYLRVDAGRDGGLHLYLRLRKIGFVRPVTVKSTSVILTLHGVLRLRMYRHQADVEADLPQYIRTLGPGTAMTVHVGTLCFLDSTDSFQLVVCREDLAADGDPIPYAEFILAAHRARELLLRAGRGARPGRGPRDGRQWLDNTPALGTDLFDAHHRGTALVNRLAADLGLLTPADADRMASSRVTLLLDRLSVAWGIDFEARWNMNPRRINQEVPHDHGYNFTSRILRGGYLHVVRRRLDCWKGPLDSRALPPAIVVLEHRGSSFTLSHTMVHQGPDVPRPATLFVRGPRLKARSNAAADLMPSVDTWPPPAEPGDAPSHSRPITLREFEDMRPSLSSHDRALSIWTIHPNATRQAGPGKHQPARSTTMSITLTTDHPAWIGSPDGTCARAVKAADSTWMAVFGPAGLTLSCVDGPEDAKPSLDGADHTTLPATVPSELRVGLADIGTVVRLTNASLWDAITLAIMRRVIRAQQARKVYRRWCESYGTAITASGYTRHLAPHPDQVLALDKEQFGAVGARFHYPAMQAAAALFPDRQDEWAVLPPAGLAAALITIPGVGPWTAAAAAADFTGDFSVYPHSDLAVRTWAARIAPAYEWPQTEEAFEKHWRNIAGAKPADLHTLTLTTLTWGAHARTAEHANL
ncbi:hypothetical protein [Streptomyces sp. NPDC008121]|uniref:hypothetical protein n=1 Tax=Streptomyces sp. NPDC008121 TaxID=3364809 RepID=UPI0036E9ECCC